MVPQGQSYILAEGFKPKLRRLFGARMGAIVHLRQLCGRQLRIALRCRKPFVSQQFLYGAKIGALLLQMSPEGVAQRVRVDIGGEPA